jgi:hypothetical protein
MDIMKSKCKPMEKGISGIIKMVMIFKGKEFRIKFRQNPI